MIKKYLKHAVFGLKNIIVRFPFEFLCVIGLTVISYILLEQPSMIQDWEQVYIKMMIVLFLGFWLFLSNTLLYERYGYKRVFKSIGWLIVSLIIAGYYYYLGALITIDSFNFEYIRYYIFAQVAFLFTFLIPSIGKNKKNLFWVNLSKVFFGALIAIFFAGVLYIIFSIFISSLNMLFDLDIDYIYYMRLAIFLFAFFMPTFFLATYPTDVEGSLEKMGYSKYLKIFGQYILMSGVLGYAGILFAYGIKILITQTWPEGGVVWLIIWFSVVLLFTLLILSPLRYQEENKGIRLFYKYFSLIFVPLLVMYFLSLSIRIGEYGFTINRGFVLLYGLWLAFASIYMFLSKDKSLRILLGSLSLVFFVANIGPWSVYNIAKNSQLDSLEDMLDEYGYLQDGKFIKSPDTVSNEVQRSIYSKLDYISDYYGDSELKRFIGPELEKKLDGKRYYAKSSIIGEYLGLTSTYKYGTTNYDYFSYYFEDGNLDINVEGYKVLKEINYYKGKNNLNISGGEYKIALNDNNTINISKGINTAIQIDLGDIVNKLQKKYGLNCYSAGNSWCSNDDISVVVQEIGDFKVKLFINSIYGNFDNDKINITDFRGFILLK